MGRLPLLRDPDMRAAGCGAMNRPTTAFGWRPVWMVKRYAARVFYAMCRRYRIDGRKDGITMFHARENIRHAKGKQ